VGRNQLVEQCQPPVEAADPDQHRGGVGQIGLVAGRDPERFAKRCQRFLDLALAMKQPAEMGPGGGPGRRQDRGPAQDQGGIVEEAATGGDFRHQVHRLDVFGYCLQPFADEDFERLAERYLAESASYRRTDRPFFTDKMPGNWPYVGLIQLMLPNARIVDVRRDPRDCCFANYAQHFQWGMSAMYGQTDLAAYYRDYVRLMRHFDAVLPGRIHRIIYEDLVDDVERQVRSLLGYLGLPFEPGCLRFFDTDRAVHSPSAQQVRRPINRDGIGRWRSYEPSLQPLIAALGDLPESYRR
jgi:hypothetical protein